jgi:hypothetical protein
MDYVPQNPELESDCVTQPTCGPHVFFSSADDFMRSVMRSVFFSGVTRSQKAITRHPNLCENLRVENRPFYFIYIFVPSFCLE